MLTCLQLQTFVTVLAESTGLDLNKATIRLKTSRILKVFRVHERNGMPNLLFLMDLNPLCCSVSRPVLAELFLSADLVSFGLQAGVVCLVIRVVQLLLSGLLLALLFLLLLRRLPFLGIHEWLR